MTQKAVPCKLFPVTQVSAGRVGCGAERTGNHERSVLGAPRVRGVRRGQLRGRRQQPVRQRAGDHRDHPPHRRRQRRLRRHRAAERAGLQRAGPDVDLQARPRRRLGLGAARAADGQRRHVPHRRPRRRRLPGPDDRQLDQRRVVRVALPHLLGRTRRAHRRADRPADGRRVRRGRRRRERRRAPGPGLSVRLGRPPQPGPPAAAARLPAGRGPALPGRGPGVRADRHRRAVGGRGRPERRRSRRPGGGQLPARVRVPDRLLPLLGHGGRLRPDAAGAADRHRDAGLPGRLQRRRPAGDPVLRQQHGADLLERRGPFQPGQPPGGRDGGAQRRVPPR